MLSLVRCMKTMTLLIPYSLRLMPVPCRPLALDWATAGCQVLALPAPTTAPFGSLAMTGAGSSPMPKRRWNRRSGAGVHQFAGEANWWAPAPLRRLHDRWGLQEAPATEQTAEPRVAVAARD